MHNACQLLNFIYKLIGLYKYLDAFLSILFLALYIILKLGENNASKKMVHCHYDSSVSSNY